MDSGLWGYFFEKVDFLGMIIYYLVDHLVIYLKKNMKNSNDNMEKSRLRINRLRKLVEQIKIEEQNYYEKFGDDNLKIVLVKNTKMKFERYDDRKIPLLPTSKKKFI
jgi:hypothetical protein